MTKTEMIAEIMITVRTNFICKRDPRADEVLLALCFRTESELKAICQELHIRTDQ